MKILNIFFDKEEGVKYKGIAGVSMSSDYTRFDCNFVSGMRSSRVPIAKEIVKKIVRIQGATQKLNKAYGKNKFIDKVSVNKESAAVRNMIHNLSIVPGFKNASISDSPDNNGAISSLIYIKLAEGTSIKNFKMFNCDVAFSNIDTVNSNEMFLVVVGSDARGNILIGDGTKKCIIYPFDTINNINFKHDYVGMDRYIVRDGKLPKIKTILTLPPHLNNLLITDKPGVKFVSRVNKKGETVPLRAIYNKYIANPNIKLARLEKKSPMTIYYYSDMDKKRFNSILLKFRKSGISTIIRCVDREAYSTVV